MVRYTPQGRIDRTIAFPVTQPTSCCFGGPNLDTLYVTSAMQRIEPVERAVRFADGDVLRAGPEAAHAVAASVVHAVVRLQPVDRGRADIDPVELLLARMPHGALAQSIFAVDYQLGLAHFGLIGARRPPVFKSKGF